MFSLVSLCFCREIGLCGFEERPLLNNSWIDGGYLVVEYLFANLIENDRGVLEQNPFEAAVGQGESVYFQHGGFYGYLTTLCALSYRCSIG